MDRCGRLGRGVSGQVAGISSCRERRTSIIVFTYIILQGYTPYKSGDSIVQPMLWSAKVAIPVIYIPDLATE